MRPFLLGVSSLAFEGAEKGIDGVRGVPGEVGGRARGAELMEWDPRLCECGLDGPACGDRVLVKVIVTANGSPAK